MPKHYILLLIAIVAEIAATSALPATQQFTRLGPSLFVISAYGLCFYFMALAMQFMPVGAVYAIWSGLGVVGVAALGYLWHGQMLDRAAVLGIALIVAGVLVIHLFSRASGH